MMDTIGIDISKDALDAYWLSKWQHKQFANTKAGLGALEAIVDAACGHGTISSISLIPSHQSV